MRALRLALAGQVMLVLLAWVGGAATAQEDAESTQAVSLEAAVFDGTMPYPSSYLDPTYGGAYEQGKTTIRDEGFEVFFEDVSDPRLRGMYRNIINRDTHSDEPMANVWSAASRIDNAGGSWLGRFTGYLDPFPDRRLWHHQGILEGRGAYEGLTAIMFLQDIGGNYDVHGMIFPGELPEFPAYPEPSSE